MMKEPDRALIFKALDWHVRCEKRSLGRKIKHLTRLKAKSDAVKLKQRAKVSKLENSRDILGGAQIDLMCGRCMELLSDEDSLAWMSNKGLRSADKEKESITHGTNDGNLVALAIVLSSDQARKRLLRLCERDYHGCTDNATLKVAAKKAKPSGKEVSVSIESFSNKSVSEVENIDTAAIVNTPRQCKGIVGDDFFMNSGVKCNEDHVVRSDHQEADYKEKPTTISTIANHESSRKKKTKSSTSSSRKKPKDGSMISKPRNRLGQRARQKMWVQKYGTKADALKDSSKSDEVHSRLKKVLHSSKKDSKILRSEKNRSSHPIKNVSLDADQFEEPSHPSWQAKRKQSNAMLVSYQGSKITFDDD